MPEKLKKMIGVILLIFSVGGVSCGSVLHAIIPQDVIESASEGGK